MRCKRLSPFSRARLAAALACLAPPAWAQQATHLQVPDNTVPAAPYFSTLVSGEDQDGVAQGYSFPIRPQLLAPGVLRTEGTPVFSGQWMTQSLAVVGDDAGSRQWLSLHVHRLRSLAATVVVVAAESADAFKDLQRIASGLAVVPEPGWWLQSRLAAAHAGVYPLFIGLDGLARQHIFSLGLDADAPHEPKAPS